MKLVIQRVSKANVIANGKQTGKINTGLLILVGIENEDSFEDIEWLCKKTTSLRIFNDHNDVMNLSVKDIDGEILLISQFTLHASVKKGNRPSYIKAAQPQIAIPLYNDFIKEMEKNIGKKIQTGIFGADMQVELINNGPVTIIIDSKNRV